MAVVAGFVWCSSRAQRGGEVLCVLESGREDEVFGRGIFELSALPQWHGSRKSRAGAFAAFC